jgi:soluble lytic murein transglycosylase-like protein
MAASPANEAIQVDALFAEPCRELNIPEPLVRAIAKVESSMNPWTVNVAGRSYFFESKAEALAKVREAWPSGRSIDVGLMQVNRWWLERYQISLEAALDPLANIYLGGWILKQELGRHKNARAAVGAYHSPDRRRAGRYADQVMKALESGPKKTPQKAPSPQASATPINPGPQPPAQMKIADNSDNTMKVSFK